MNNVVKNVFCFPNFVYSNDLFFFLWMIWLVSDSPVVLSVQGGCAPGAASKAPYITTHAILA